MSYKYGCPLSISTILGDEMAVRSVLESTIEYAAKLCEDNKDDVDFIPPIVYSDLGKAFNIDYNYLVFSLAWFAGIEEIEYDFMLHKNMDAVTTKYAHFLVVSLFENYYELVRLNSRKINISKYKNAKEFVIKERFYNSVCIKNGGNIRYFQAVPFNRIKLQKFLDDKTFLMLCEFAENDQFEQVSFGDSQFYAYQKANEIDYVEHVFVRN